jgi:fructose-bisphosphate aldolase, class I
MVDVSKILRDGKCFLLAYDQGLEHGPTDFNDINVDPQYILDIAVQTKVYTGLVFQEGIAEKYYPIGGVEKSKYPPLILKLNGKTSFHKGEEAVSLQLTSVDRAVQLGATGVGYTIYVGSEREQEMMVEFRRICDEAHAKGLIVIAWMYPRGKHVEGKEDSRDVVAYAARLSLELGADFAKLPYTGDPESFSWVVKNAGKTQVLVQGGSKKEEAQLLQDVKGFMQAGAAGMAVGRNIWQADNPAALTSKISDLIFNSKVEI